MQAQEIPDSPAGAAHRLSFWNDGSGVFTDHRSLFIIHYSFYILHSTAFSAFSVVKSNSVQIRMIRVIRVLLSGYKPLPLLSGYKPLPLSSGYKPLPLCVP